MSAVTTPTCRSCGTKFPGRDSCKSCGCDPDAPPSIARKVMQAVPDPMDRGRRRALRRSLTSSQRRRGHGRQ